MAVVRKGEVYWVKNVLDGKSDGKKKRPALVISAPEEGDKYNDVNIVFLTHTPRWDAESNVEIRKTNNGKCEGSVALCNKVFWMAENAIHPLDFICALSEEDMRRVDWALAKRMGLAYLLRPTQAVEPEKAEVRYAPGNEDRSYRQKYDDLVEKIIEKCF